MSYTLSKGDIWTASTFWSPLHLMEPLKAWPTAQVVLFVGRCLGQNLGISSDNCFCEVELQNGENVIQEENPWFVVSLLVHGSLFLWFHFETLSAVYSKNNITKTASLKFYRENFQGYGEWAVSVKFWFSLKLTTRLVFFKWFQRDSNPQPPSS